MSLFQPLPELWTFFSVFLRGGPEISPSPETQQAVPARTRRGGIPLVRMVGVGQR
jgi:hypothetical protein